MLLVSLAVASAASPPSLDAPPPAGPRSRKDIGVVVGVEDYAALPDAVGVRADTAAFGAWLTRGRGVDDARVALLQDPTAASARTAVARAARDVKRGGTLWVYWAGHGAFVDGERVLLGSDATADAPGDGSVPLDELVALAEGSRAKQVVLVVDAGFGGRGRDGEPLFAAPAAVPPLPTRTDDRVVVWSATSGAEPSYRYPANDHGLFGYLVVGALRGWADGQIGAPADGRVSLQEAQGYVARVLRQLGGPEQKPTKDTRPVVTAWTLTAGPLESGPSKEDLAALALVEKARRVRTAEQALLAVAKAEWDPLSARAAAPSPQAEADLSAFLAKYDAATVTVDGTQVAVAVPWVAEARARLDDFARKNARGSKKKKKARRTSARQPAPPPVATATCRDLLSLEPKAITGELTPDLVRCLESRIDEEKLLTTKDKLSRMLLVNADARGDIAEWTRLAARHLEDFDRSDPDLCFKFALLLSRGPIEDAELVLRWSDYALENKHTWDGPTYMSRVYNLLRLKSETAARLWHDAEDDFIADRTEQNELEAERWRGVAKDYAREWLDYARSSAQPADRPFVLCESASGNAAFCAEG